ncbi:cupin domain-containing protein [Phragmitibacter flavus]|nr:cupin domain-containing protein [Phragmitibacter flavus]
MQKHLSLAIGGKKDCGLERGGHPFDVSEVRIPAGKTNWPLHVHSKQWEFYLVKSGKGLVRTSDGEMEIGVGDYLMQTPGVAHQVINQGNEDLVMLVIADNPAADMIRYPASKKYFLKPSRVMFGELGESVEYYEGEE